MLNLYFYIFIFFVLKFLNAIFQVSVYFTIVTNIVKLFDILLIVELLICSKKMFSHLAE